MSNIVNNDGPESKFEAFNQLKVNLDNLDKLYGINK